MSLSEALASVVHALSAQDATAAAQINPALQFLSGVCWQQHQLNTSRSDQSQTPRLSAVPPAVHSSVSALMDVFIDESNSMQRQIHSCRAVVLVYMSKGIYGDACQAALLSHAPRAAAALGRTLAAIAKQQASPSGGSATTDDAGDMLQAQLLLTFLLHPGDHPGMRLPQQQGERIAAAFCAVDDAVAILLQPTSRQHLLTALVINADQQTRRVIASAFEQHADAAAAALGRILSAADPSIPKLQAGCLLHALVALDVMAAAGPRARCALRRMPDAAWRAAASCTRSPDAERAEWALSAAAQLLAAPEDRCPPAARCACGAGYAAVAHLLAPPLLAAASGRGRSDADAAKLVPKAVTALFGIEMREHSRDDPTSTIGQLPGAAAAMVAALRCAIRLERASQTQQARESAKRAWVTIARIITMIGAHSDPAGSKWCNEIGALGGRKLQELAEFLPRADEVLPRTVRDEDPEALEERASRLMTSSWNRVASEAAREVAGLGAQARKQQQLQGQEQQQKQQQQGQQKSQSPQQEQQQEQQQQQQGQKSAPRACAACGKTKKTGATQLLKCDACRQVLYCSRTCQALHRESHRAECLKAAK